MNLSSSTNRNYTALPSVAQSATREHTFLVPIMASKSGVIYLERTKRLARRVERDTPVCFSRDFAAQFSPVGPSGNTNLRLVNLGSV